jgi:hypothetical protein
MNRESATIEELVRANMATADRTPGHAKRGQHPKHHGCVRAVLLVANWIPAEFRSGIFEKPRTFEALIRFSNGRVWDDRKADAHGMAIKLLGVPGRKLVDGHETETAADFVLVDSEVFFTGDLTEYLAFSAGLLRPRRNLLYDAFFWTKILLWHRALFTRVRSFVGKRPTSPLAIKYFSAVPYRLGSHAVKYVARPRDPRIAAPNLGDRDGLSRALADTLAIADASFDFGVEIQTNTNTQPIEDPTVNWSEQEDARHEWLGIITIPRQDVDPNSALAENLAFSPWHTIEEHRPLGAINRARLPVYRDMSKLRHELNGVVPPGTSEIPVG